MRNVFSKHTVSVLIAILAVVVLSLSITLLCLSLYQKDIQTNTTQVSATTNENNSYQYILKEYQGKVGVFEPGEETPEEVLDIDPTILPETDQEDLRNGILIDNADDLRALIEDFDG